MHYLSHCSHPFFGLKEIIRHPHLTQTWRRAGHLDRWSRSDVERLQQMKLNKLITYAALRVPYYRNLFKTKQIDVDRLTLADFPIMMKQDIRAHVHELVSDDFSIDALHATSTSGSTGEPFTFYKAPHGISSDWSYAALWRGLNRFHIRPGDKRVLVRGVDSSPTLSKIQHCRRKLYEQLNRCIMIDAHFLAKSNENIEKELKRIISFRPDYIHGYASSIYVLAKYALEHGVQLSDFELKAVVTESEKCMPFHRDVFEKVFHAPVVENYGSVEFGMIAQPGPDGILCINEDHVFVETTASGDGVMTNLDEYAFPLIRYQNGDMLRLGGLHSTLPYKTIEQIDGRKTEEIHLPNGSVLQGYSVMYPIYLHGKYIQSYQIYQPNLENLIIRIVPNETDLPESVQKQIVSDMGKLMGAGVAIHLDIVDHIPLTKRGKRIFVCSDVTHP